MNKIVTKEEISSDVTKLDFFAPDIAKRNKPGQFVILRINKNGERFPLTITDTNTQKGTVEIIFQNKLGTVYDKTGSLNKYFRIGYMIDSKILEKGLMNISRYMNYGKK